MRSRTLAGAMPLMAAVFLMVVSCAREEAEQANQAAAPATETTPAPAASHATGPAAGSDAGAKVYRAYCEACHGTTGRGDGAAAEALKPRPADFAIGAFKYDVNGNGATGDIDDIKAIVHDGAAKHGGSPLMAPWPTLSPDQLQSIAEYVKSLQGG